MFTFQGHQKAKKRFYIKLVWVFVLVIIVVLLKPTWIIWNKYLLSRKNLTESRRELQEIKQRKIILENEINNLNTLSGQEKEVIKKFDLVREGEQLAVIIEEDEETKMEEIKKGSFRKFIDWFIGIF